MIITWLRALLSWFRRRLPWSKENGSGQLLWSRRLENHAFGNFSMAAIEANLPMEDRSVVNAGVNVTLVGVFDGHNDSLASSYVNSNLLEHLLLAASGGQPIEQAIESAFVRTEREFLDIVRESEEQYQRSATSCLVGVIWQGRLSVASLGDSRAFLGYLDTATNNIRSYELSSRHHTSSEVIRKELLDAHPNENKLFTEIEVNQRETLYLIKAVTEVSRAIGYACLKSYEFSLNARYPNYLLTPTSKPLIRADPEIRTRDIGNNDKFVIFGSAEFWKHLGDEKAVHIVHENAREGIAKILLEKALKNAARAKDIEYSDLHTYEKGPARLKIHNDMSVVVIFIDYERLRVENNSASVCVRAPPETVEVSLSKSEIMGVAVT